MKALLFVLLMSVGLFCQAQNGGQKNENNVVLIKKYSSTATTVTVAVTNKQVCAADYQVDYPNSNQPYNINFGETKLITVTIVGGAKFKVRALTACINQPDMGWVELDILQYLPVKFGKIELISTKKNY